MALTKAAGSVGNSEMWSDSGYSLKTKLREFPGKFYSEYERRKSRMTARFLA